METSGGRVTIATGHIARLTAVAWIWRHSSRTIARWKATLLPAKNARLTLNVYEQAISAKCKLPWFSQKLVVAAMDDDEEWKQLEQEVVALRAEDPNNCFFLSTTSAAASDVPSRYIAGAARDGSGTFDSLLDQIDDMLVISEERVLADQISNDRLQVQMDSLSGDATGNVDMPLAAAEIDAVNIYICKGLHRHTHTTSTSSSISATTARFVRDERSRLV